MKRNVKWIKTGRFRLRSLDSDQYNDNYETEAEREPECLHISYTEQAGGFAICDECGEDVTREAIRRGR